MASEESRRNLIGSMAAFDVAQMLPENVAAQEPKAASARRNRIDVHHHMLPPEYVAKVGETAIGAPAPNLEAPKWTVARSLKAMDENDIATAVVSISAPGIWFNDAKLASYLARASNSFGAQMKSDHPGRFGSFASLPLPDVKASLEELKYALDVLKCDGISFMTNYGDRYLGDPEFAPIFDELNVRGAVAYVHPTSCNCSLGVMSEIPASMIEFPHDSTRTIVSLMYSGTFTRCPNIRFIFSHAGGTLPFLANRIALLGKLHKAFAERVPGGVMPLLQQLNFDTALSANAIAIPALLKIVSPKKVMLGTDFPFAPEMAMKGQIADLKALNLPEQDMLDIERGNAVRLFKTFGAV